MSIIWTKVISLGAL